LLRGDSVPVERGEAAKLQGADWLGIFCDMRASDVVKLIPLGERASASPAAVELGGKLATADLQK